MHLIGRQIGGGVAADQEGVEVAAAGAVDQARLLRGLGRVFVAQQVAPGCAAGGDRSLDQGAGAGAELLLLGRGDGGGQGVERTQQTSPASPGFRSRSAWARALSTTERA